MKSNKIKKIVKSGYKKIAQKSKSCCKCSCVSKNNSDTSRSIGYSDDDINNFSEADLGLGCGNPVAISSIKEGDIVLDLGSGAGFDAFLAAQKVGDKGRVIGVDMTEEMINKATDIAVKRGYKNVEFKLADIEELPLDDESIDIIISNCVINLAPDKAKVFVESYRVLKSGGKMYISDIVLLEELSEEQKNDKKLITGCVAGAILRDEYIKMVKESGFKVKILKENKDIDKPQYKGVALESLSLEISK